MAKTSYSFLQKPILLNSGSFMSKDSTVFRFVTSSDILKNYYVDGTAAAIDVYLLIQEVDSNYKKEYYQTISAVIEHDLSATDGNIWWSFNLPLNNYVYIDYQNKLSYSSYGLIEGNVYNLKIALYNSYDMTIDDLPGIEDDFCASIHNKLTSMFLSDFSNFVQFTYIGSPSITFDYLSSTNQLVLKMSFDTYDRLAKYQITLFPADPALSQYVYKTPILYVPTLVYTTVDEYADLPSGGASANVYYKTSDTGQIWCYYASAWVNAVRIVIDLAMVVGGVEYIPYFLIKFDNGYLYDLFGSSNIIPATLSGTAYALNLVASDVSPIEGNYGIPEISITAVTTAASYQIALKRKVGTGDWVLMSYYDSSSATFIATVYDYLCPLHEDETITYGISVINNIDIEGREDEMATGSLIESSVSNANIITGADKLGVVHTYGLLATVNFGDMELTINAGTQDTLGGMYPYYIRNAKTEYYKSSISGLVIEDFDRCVNQMSYENRKALEVRRNAFMAFISNGLPKVLRTWNGDVRVIAVSSPAQYRPNNDLSGTLGTVSFDYVEVCSPTDYTTLTDLGITESLLASVEDA